MLSNARRSVRTARGLFIARGLAVSGVIVALAGASTAQIGACPPEWKGMPQDHGDADLAVGGSHVLVADHDHYRVFTKCGQNLSFLDPVCATGFPNGILLNGQETLVQPPPLPTITHNGFYYTTGTYAQQNGTPILADERVIFDPLTNRYIAMATTPPAEGIFLGVSAVNDARTWPTTLIRTIPMEVPCLDFAGALHRGSISTSNDPLNAGDSLIWFLGEVQGPQCVAASAVWQVGKIRMSQYLSGNSDPDSWWQEASEVYGAFTPTLARRMTNDGSPQYAIGAHFASNSLKLLALRAEEDAQGHLLAPYEYPISLTLPPYNYPPFHALPNDFPTTILTTKINDFPSAAIWKAIYRDGHIWAVHCDGVGGRSQVRWYKIAMNDWKVPNMPGTPTIVESGFLDPGNNLDCYVPSIAAHANNGAVAITYNATGSNQRVSIYSHTRCNSTLPFDPAVLQYIHPNDVPANAGTMGNMDYSGTVEDPSVPGRFWLHHCLYGPPLESQLAGTIVRRFQASACGADFTGDGVANGNDVAAFGAYYAQGAPEADFVPDEVVNGDDILEYLAVGLP